MIKIFEIYQSESRLRYFRFRFSENENYFYSSFYITDEFYITISNYFGLEQHDHQFPFTCAIQKAVKGKILSLPTYRLRHLVQPFEFNC